ncbi:carbon-monoxide dehydrogenase medium subunit [Methylobacterium sp. PvP062]|uniref:Carbon-monoxide dehydrogenase medium subunit n=1 Tax=Methylobacterium radiotolerans TaxID=31998 RepID=A0ABV2NTS5_9HYPH|nr:MULTISPECIES: FAD binding domain-containing protein [unclassified Methylobacterium]MBP2498289.1 carbon-monoxide dehydrogenase medium subunit [Methylobacterium sp. PvP105]MBP2505673.1 carbon-monoxide dehydrogenase medium subunit [Methylobacterium sp. PvP109]
MTPAAYEYVLPADVASAIAALEAADGEGKVIAGGQSLGPMLNLRIARPRVVVDISRMPELRAIEDHGTHWRVGSATTHAEIEDGALAVAGRTCPFASVARRIAYRAIRNRGTIGGSLAHADPSADWVLALTTMGATVNVAGPGGRRKVTCADLMITTFTTVLAPEEIIVSVDLPKSGKHSRWGYAKVCRKVGEFPSASAAIISDPDRDGCRIYLGALGGPPQPLTREGESLDDLDASIAALTDRVGEAAPDLDGPDRQIFTHCLARAIDQARHA